MINKVYAMSFEVLEQLEAKIQTAVDTITLLQMEVDELKEEKQRLQEENHQINERHVALEQEAERIKQEHHSWEERIRGLLNKMGDVE